MADSQGRFPPIIVPAVEVTPGTVFSCDIQGLVPDYPGVTAIINLGFQSSLFNVPFYITNQALTIYRCSAGERYHSLIHREHCMHIPLIKFQNTYYNYKHMITSPVTKLARSTAVRIASGQTVRVDGVTSTSNAVEHQLIAGMHLTSYR